MPLNSAPKFVVSTNSHSYLNNNNNNSNNIIINNNSVNSNSSSNNSNGGKLLICLRDLSKFRDQTLKSPNGNGSVGPQLELGGNKSSPIFRNSTDVTGSQKHSPDFKSVSSVVKREHSESSGRDVGDKRSTPEVGQLSPQRFQPSSQAVPENGERGSGSPKIELSEDARKREEARMQASPGGDESLKDTEPSKQLNKLKRFLSTLQQFANDISKEIGDCVQTLIYWLVHAKISVEDFHQRLQQATNFPLRPFVVPFLKASLPLLQMELIQHNRYSPSLLNPSSSSKNGGNAGSIPSSLPNHHHFLLPPLTDLPPLLIPFSDALNGSLGKGFPRDLARMDLEGSQYFHRGDFNVNGKRTSPDRSPQPTSSTTNSQSSSSSSSSSFSRPPYKKRRSTSPRPPVMLTSDPSLRTDLYKSQKFSEPSTEGRSEIDKRLLENSSLNGMLNGAWERFEERSSHIENLLLTLLNVTDKCSQKMTTLKAQMRQDFEKISAHVLKDLSDQRINSGGYLQKLDVKMKTEKVVNEVKQQAMLEMQRAVAAAEAKASMAVANERMKLERVVEDARKEAKQEILDILNRQEESNENCWNCGRLASETCSGCNEARYCGLFCQHKDWEIHHRVCRQTQGRLGDRPKPAPLGSRSLLVPADGISPWSVVPNFLFGRTPFLGPSRIQKPDKDERCESRKTPPLQSIKTERRDTPPATDVNSNVISSTLLREKVDTSESSDGSNHSSPRKENERTHGEPEGGRAG